MGKKTANTLFATLGVNPQVVTISLDLLAAQGYLIDEVVAIYTNNEKVKEGVRLLQEELQRIDGLTYHLIPMVGSAGLVEDFLTEADATALLRTLYRELKARKQSGRQIHLMIAGGRGIMGAYALVVAQLLFDEDDRCWHLFSDFWQQDRNRKMRLEPGDQAILVPVPVLRWSPMATMAADFAFSDDPWQVIEQQQVLQQRERDLRLQMFLKSLKPAKRDVARLLAEGLDNEAIAARRNKSVHTVKKQISDIYAEWRNFFDLPENASVRDQVVSELAGYFARQGDR